MTTTTARTEIRTRGHNHNGNEVNHGMLLYEDLARARMLEAERSAAACRQAELFAAARRWERIAGWAAKRALTLRTRSGL